MIRIYTSYKAISLKTVANHIAKVAKFMNIDAEVRTSYEPAHFVKKYTSSAIIVMTADPMAANPWILFARDLTKVGVKNVYYGVVEGRLNYRHVSEWMSSVRFVAPSEYVAMKMKATGLNVVGVVPHGIDLDEVREGEKAVPKAIEYMGKFGLDPSKHIIALTIANAHPRKGLAWLDRVAEIVAKFTKPIKFFVITEAEGLKYFRNRENLVVSTDFGKLPRDLVLGLIKASHMVVIPSFSEGFCLPPETYIVTIDGLKPIKDVKEGYLVLTHRGRFRRVLKVTSRRYNGELVVIKPWLFNIPIRLTPEHLVLSIKRSMTRKPKWNDRDKADSEIWLETEPVWVRADEIEEGDIVFFPIPQQIYDVKYCDLKDFDNTLQYDAEYVWYPTGYSPKTDELKKYKRFVKVDKDLAKLIGLYIAEGSVNSNQMGLVEFSFGDEPDLVAETVEALRKVFGVEALIKREGNKTRVIASGKILAKFFSTLCGAGAHNKSIPPEILYGDKEILKTVVEYVWKGDGTKTVCGNSIQYRITTVSRQLMNDLKIALIRLGIRCFIKQDIRHNRGTIEYEVAWVENQKSPTHSNKGWIIKDRYIALLVKEVTKEKYDGIVYNLEVEEDNSYTTESFVVHNCLPALEAMALGTPCVATELPPLKEFARCWFVPYSQISFFDKTPVGGSGIIYEQYVYEPEDFVAQILNVADLILNKREVVEAWRLSAMWDAQKLSIKNVYPKLIRMVL